MINFYLFVSKSFCVCTLLTRKRLTETLPCISSLPLQARNWTSRCRPLGRRMYKSI